MIQILYDELCEITASIQKDGITTIDSLDLISRACDMEKNLDEIDREKLPAEEAAVFKKAFQLSQAFSYAFIQYLRTYYVDTPGIAARFDKMTPDQMKKTPVILQKTYDVGNFTPTVSAKSNNCLELIEMTGGIDEDTLDGINELRQMLSNPDSEQEFADMAVSFQYEKTGDACVDYFLEWCSLLGNQDTYRLFLNEKILEYFKLYYQRESSPCPFSEFAGSSCEGQASVPIEKLHAFVNLDENFLHLAYPITGSIFNSVFLNGPYVMTADDYGAFQGYLADFSEKQLMQQNWFFACLFQMLKKLSDSEFREFFSDGESYPEDYDEMYAEILKKYGYTSDFLELRKVVEGTSIMENAEIAESRKPLLMELIFCFGMWELFAGNEVMVNRLYDAFSSGTRDCLMAVVSCMNETAALAGIKRSDGKKPFFPLDSMESSVLEHAIYTLKSYNAGSSGFILNEMNFVEKQQTELFSLLPGKEKYKVSDYGNDTKAREAAEKEWEEKSKNRKRLAVIDCGCTLRFRQTIPFYPEEIAYLDREMQCRYFSIPDKEFTHQTNKWGKEKNTCHQIRYDEVYRVSNKNNLTTVYLQLIRNIETHFARHHSVEALMNDKYPKESFLEAFLDCLEFAGKIVDNDPDRHHKTAAELMIHFFADLLNRICLEVFPEEEVIGKPVMKLLYYEDLSEIKEEALGKVESVKFQTFPEYVLNPLEKILNWFYGIESDFLDRNRFNVTFYLIYLSFALSNERKS